ncbi:MAG: selenocysteine-specific elongation factor [Ascidiaceihabitans sp.]|jgi:selenocysteine-specific elongation factor
MKTCCIVVVGHVDHGKTSLVHALTGIETDRLPEEKARGMSIAPGFAHSISKDGTIDFIDAPGHADYIQAMICGATGASGVLVVVSAVEGIGAQTLEHLCIAGLLGITNGVIAVTKSDLLSPSQMTERLIEIRAVLLRTPFSNAQVVICSALTGYGLDDLHKALGALLLHTTDVPRPLQSYLPIDRVFSLTGQGTIVTGTLLGKDLKVDDTVVLQPSGQTITIRGLQCRGEKRDVIYAGERMAANLRGVGVADIARGDVLCTGGSGKPSACVDVHIELLPETTLAIKHMDEVRILFGTSSVVANVRLFGGARISPANSGYAQLRFKESVVAFAGQRGVLRRLSPSEMIGGVVFLDPQATPTMSSDKNRVTVLDAAQTQDATIIAQALCRSQGGVAHLADVARISRMTTHSAGLKLSDSFQTFGDDLVSSTEDIEACQTKILKSLAAFHEIYPLRALVPYKKITQTGASPALLNHAIRVLLSGGEIRQQDNRFATREHDPIARLSKDQQVRLTDIEGTFRSAGLTALKPENYVQNQLDQDLLELLNDAGRLVSLQNISLKQTWFVHSDTITAASISLRVAFPTPRIFTTSDARIALATSRRVIVPVLEHFDNCGVTLRVGDARQMGGTNLVSLQRSTC